MKSTRPEGALLAGVCAGIARIFDWNVWALRALFVLFLLIQTLWALAAYAALAGAFLLLGTDWRVRHKTQDGFESPELAARGRRIAELERRFDDLQRRA